MNEFVRLVLAYLPAFAANAAPVLFFAVPSNRQFAHPICEKHLGKNKTYAGFAAGMLAAGIVALLQFESGLSAFDSLSVTLLFGLLCGLGALSGDLCESAVKRSFGIASGKPLPFWDGADYIIGALIFTWPLHATDWRDWIILLIIGPLASLAANTFSYFVGWKKVWY